MGIKIAKHRKSKKMKLAVLKSFHQRNVETTKKGKSPHCKIINIDVEFSEKKLIVKKYIVRHRIQYILK